MRSTHKSIFGLAAVCLVLVFAGCPDDGPGNGSGGDGGGNNGNAAQKFCEVECDWRERCNAKTATCMADCDQEAGAAADLFSQTFVDEIIKCYKGRSDCDDENDACTQQAMQAGIDSGANSADVKTCEARLEECSGAPPTSDNNFCPFLSAVSDKTRDAIKACLDKDCAAIQDCVIAAFPIVDE